MAAAAPRVRIFQSYGRRDASDLAHRLRRDLGLTGYEVWQDVVDLRAGRDWDEQIQAAMKDSAAVIAVLSPHATRRLAPANDVDQDSVCLDEIACARFSRPPKPIVPVMAVPCEPPLVIFRLDYVDFSRWQESEAEYGAALRRLQQDLDAALRGETRYRAWDGRLAPWDFAAFLNEKRRGFGGRAWLFEALEGWRRGHDERALLIVGEPGIGKSAVVAKLVQRQAGTPVLAYHCCQADTPATLEPGRFVRSLAAMAASQLPAYAQVLSRRAALELLDPALSDEDPASAFEAAFLAPLAELPAPGGGDRLLLIDALDEAAGAGRRAGIVELLAPRLERLPGWLRLVATTRPEAAVLEPLAGVRTLRLDAQDPHNRADVEAYIAGRLAEAGLADRLAGRERSPGAFQAELAARSGGSFLYARQALQGVERGLWDIDAMAALPPGLGAIFERSFARSFPDATAYAPARAALAVLLAAREPLSARQLAAICGLEPPVLRDALDRLSGMLSDVEGRLAIHHKALADWLADPDSSRQWHADPADGRARLLDYGRRWRALEDSYPLLHQPAHLAEAGLTDELRDLVLDPEFRSHQAARLKRSDAVAPALRLLAAALWQAGRDGELIELAASEDPLARDAVVAALDGTADPSPRLEAFLQTLLQHRAGPARARLNARLAAVRVAASKGVPGVLMGAAGDGSPPLRAMLVPYIYRFWRDHRDAGWRLMDELAAASVTRIGLPERRRFEVFGGVSLAILGQHYEEAETMARLRGLWQALVGRVLGSALVRAVGRRWVVAPLLGLMRLAMARQPDYQPLNLKEIVAAFDHPTESHARAALVLDALARPDAGYDAVVQPLLRRTAPFDVYLMLAAERALVLQGARDPGGVLAALARIHDEGAPWFRQSALYAGFHVLSRAAQAPDEWLATYERLAVETIEAERATMRTPSATYALVPQIAWAELVLAQHRPAAGPRFIPRFLRHALALGDLDYARRVLRASGILSLGYRRHALALDALREVVGEIPPALHDALVDALAGIRFFEEKRTDLFLREHGDEALAQRVAMAHPRIKAGDFPTWIDAFFNHLLLSDPGFRAEVVGAFRRAGAARNASAMMSDVVVWMIRLLSGERAPA